MRDSNKSGGFTLIEVLIAIVILAIGLLALLNSTAVLMERNLQNVLRDEAVRVGEQRMNELRSLPKANLANVTTTVTRPVRGFNASYTVNVTVTASGDTRTVTVLVNWNYRNVPYSHGVQSLIS